MLTLIIVIAVVVLVVGVLLAKKGFTRGEMAARPAEDTPDAASVGAGSHEGVEADPRAAGRHSDRGYEQNP